MPREKTRKLPQPVSLGPEHEELVSASRVWAAHEAEREKCAQVAEKFRLIAKCDDERALVRAIAAAIRVRTKVAALR